VWCLDNHASRPRAKVHLRDPFFQRGSSDLSFSSASGPRSRAGVVAGQRVAAEAGKPTRPIDVSCVFFSTFLPGPSFPLFLGLLHRSATRLTFEASDRIEHW
jgi:hypothetical protein